MLTTSLFLFLFYNLHMIMNMIMNRYMYLEYPLYKPFLRAHMERECSQICTGDRFFQDVIDSCIAEMRTVFTNVYSSLIFIDSHPSG